MCRHGMANRHCDDFTSVMSPAKHGQSTPRSTPFPSRMPQEGIVRCGMAEPAPVLDWRDEPHHLKALASLTSLISRTKPLARLVTPSQHFSKFSSPIWACRAGPRPDRLRMEFFLGRHRCSGCPSERPMVQRSPPGQASWNVEAGRHLGSGSAGASGKVPVLIPARC